MCLCVPTRTGVLLVYILYGAQMSLRKRGAGFPSPPFVFFCSTRVDFYTRIIQKFSKFIVKWSSNGVKYSDGFLLLNTTFFLLDIDNSLLFISLYLFGIMSSLQVSLYCTI